MNVKMHFQTKSDKIRQVRVTIMFENW